MAKKADGRKNKRLKLSGTADSSGRYAKMQENSPLNMKKDKSLRPRRKDSLHKFANRAQRDAITRLLSPRKQGMPGTNEEKGVTVLSSMAGRHSSPLDSSVSRKKVKGSPDVEDLRVYIQMHGGILEDGWQVDAQRRPAGKLMKTFISPSKERFRSRIEVAKHLGLEPALLKQGEVPKANSESRYMDQNDSEHTANETVDIVTVRDKNTSKISGKRKEYVSSIPISHEEATMITNNGLLLASDPSKAIVPAHKAPEMSTVTQRCQEVLRSIISTDNFAALSNMLNRGSASGSLESPLQINALPLIAGSLDLQLIHLRLANGVYGQTPELFSTDIQQVWKNIIAAGNELVTLAQSLLEFTNKLYNQEILSLFQGATSKESLERRELPLSTVQHGNRSIEDGGVSLDNSRILQKNQSMVTPSESTLTLARFPPEKRETPTNQNARGDGGGSPLKQAGAVYESRKWPEKAIKSKKVAMKVTHKPTLEVCKSCGLHQQGLKDCVNCKLCGAVFHSHCAGLPSKSLPDIDWCCPVCAASEIAAEPLNGSMNMEPLKVEDLKKSMVSLEGAHQHNTYPEGHNCSVHNRISTGSPAPAEENPYTEYAAVEYPSSTENARSLYHSIEQGALKLGIEKESSVDKGPPEPGFLLENENACKVCGVESKKPAVSCTWCDKRFHLSCLRPVLMKLPRKTWFCPSCLCRVCKVDVDDDQILLCDGCDEGFHTYCLNPPLSEKPEGTWFCCVCTKNAALNTPKQTQVFKRKRKSSEPRRSI